MIGKLHITTLLGPRDSAGSSLATVGCGVGENQPACTGRPGSDTSIACKPPECHESKTIVRVGVGLWEEYEVNSFSAGAGEYAVVFCRILYSPSTCGRRGWAMFQVRTQPHGQPKDGAVNVPYTSLLVSSTPKAGADTSRGTRPVACRPRHTDSNRRYGYRRIHTGRTPRAPRSSHGRTAGSPRRAGSSTTWTGYHRPHRRPHRRARQSAWPGQGRGRPVPPPVSASSLPPATENRRCRSASCGLCGRCREAGPLAWLGAGVVPDGADR